MKNKALMRDQNLTITFFMVVICITLFLTAYFWISSLIEDRSFRRMEEGVDTVTSEIAQKLTRDSQMLNTTANILANSPDFDRDNIRQIMTSINPMLETMDMMILFPDDTLIASDGSVLPNNGEISFAKESVLGEHVSDRMVSIVDGNTYVLRHFVPVIQNGETAAMLAGVTNLANLPSVLNIDHIYNASADVYIIDTTTGDYIINTRQQHLGNINEVEDPETRDGSAWSEKMQELLGLQRGHVEYRTKETVQWNHLFYAPAGINKWAIAVSVPKSEAFANVFSVRKVCLIIGSLMAVSLVIYFLWTRKNALEAVESAVEKAVLEEKLQKAEAAERAKTMFLSNMSHDIRTPMNAIIGFTTLAQTNIDNRERVQEYLTKIMSSGNHLLSLINDILDMSRIESGRLNIEEKECSISDIFRDMRNILQPQMQTKQLNFFMDTLDVVDEDIFCDKLHVNQILLNLLSNAIKFTPSGGSVSLTIRQLPNAPKGYGSYEIRVKDTGIGMSAEFKEHVFEPFERESSSTVSGIQGTGLGMAITKNIVSTMGGTIQVETQQGKGTEFIIHLNFRLQTEPKKIAVIRELQGLRTLVVDDNFNTCDSVTKMLSQIGMRVEWTLRGKEAVLYAKQSVEMKDEFCAYIIDWSLPDLGGIEVTRQIRAVVGENVPVIILTAYDWTIIEEEAREAGVTAFCNKPIFLSELRDTLVSAMNRTDAAPTESILPDPGAELKGKRLLLVEDNELNQEIAQEILRESGFEVETASDGSIAVDMVKNSSHGCYDLILMDIQMPIMNGYEATKAIRSLEDPALNSIPIVAMTANAFEEDRKAALESGMNDHIAKPINTVKLMEVLKRLLK